MKKHKRLLILLALLIIVWIIFLVTRPVVAPVVTNSAVVSPVTTTRTTPVSQTNAQTSGAQQTQGYVVTYTDQGFSPKTIQVPRGQSVKFINNSSKQLLIVADDQSSIFSQLNQPKAISKGGIYTFDFTYVGTWTFHNQSSADDRGNIVVY